MDNVDQNNRLSSYHGDIPVTPEHKIYKLKFTGTAGEYFRIWIVNTFLTILTLGVYAAWAKVRNRQYIYKHTILDNQSFEYTANPIAIFKGYLIVGLGVLLLNVTEVFNPLLNFIVLIMCYAAIPFLIYKSIRFFAHNTAFRNIRFRFLGSLGESYKTYLLYPFLIPFTLGLIIPYWAYKRRDYFFNNISFGTTHNTFNGRSGPFYEKYIITGVILVISIFSLIFIVSLLSVPLFMSTFPQDAGTPAYLDHPADSVPAPNQDSISDFEMSSDTEPSSEPEVPFESGFLVGFMIFLIGSYILIIVIYTAVQQYLYAWSTNYCCEHSSLGRLRVKCALKARTLIWIRISNIAAIICSLGLLIPWAKVRRTRYIFENISVISDSSLNEFTSAVEADESAYGDAATDFFDFEIGL